MTAPSFFDRPKTIVTDAQMRAKLAERTKGKVMPDDPSTRVRENAGVSASAENTPHRNQAEAAPSDAVIVAPTPRGSLPNSLGTSLEWSETRYCTDSQGRRTPDGYQVSLCGRYRIERSAKLDKPQYTAYQNKPWAVFGPYATAAEAKAQCTP